MGCTGEQTQLSWSPGSHKKTAKHCTGLQHSQAGKPSYQKSRGGTIVFCTRQSKEEGIQVKLRDSGPPSALPHTISAGIFGPKRARGRDSREGVGAKALKLSPACSSGRPSYGTPAPTLSGSCSAFGLDWVGWGWMGGCGCCGDGAVRQRTHALGSGLALSKPSRHPYTWGALSLPAGRPPVCARRPHSPLQPPACSQLALPPSTLTFLTTL